MASNLTKATYTLIIAHNSEQVASRGIRPGGWRFESCHHQILGEKWLFIPLNGQKYLVMWFLFIWLSRFGLMGLSPENRTKNAQNSIQNIQNIQKSFWGVWPITWLLSYKHWTSYSPVFRWLLTLKSRRFPVWGEVSFCIRTLPNR